MPELPEVETMVRGLEPHLRGRTLRNLRLHHSDVLRDVSARRLVRALEGRRVAAVTRRAKHVVLGLDDGRRLIIQPRMTGTFLIRDGPLGREERRYAVLEASVGGRTRFVFRDVRRLGTIHLLDEAGWSAYTARIGPEPLAPTFNLDRFTERMQSTRQAIKKALMDQHLLAGVGNIYANEALFRAGVDPSRGADHLRPTELGRLFRAVRAVLRGAIRAGGTTIRDYRTSTGTRGSYQTVLQVYGRTNEPCVRCRTRLVTTHVIDGRSTTFCWRCQGGGS